MTISFGHSSLLRLVPAAAFGMCLALATTPAPAQECDPDVCANPWDVLGLYRLPPQAQAEPLCLFEPVVWVNTRFRVYHVAGSRGYGHGRRGVYMCEAEARFAGYRPASR